MLIPKVDCSSKLNGYQPISLCNTIYKVISKILVNWIKPFLSQLILQIKMLHQVHNIGKKYVDCLKACPYYAVLEKTQAIMVEDFA